MGESPAWMARRLTLAGMRPISNVVDVTNYVLLERGQPLHAFDLGRLPRPRHRRAARGRRRADDDARRRRAHAHRRGPPRLRRRGATRRRSPGSWAAREAEVHDDTTEILLEAAYFQPMGISRSSKRLGLRSESSARFERGVDPNGVLGGSDACRGAAARSSPARTSRPNPIDQYPVPVDPGPHHRARARGSRRCSASSSAPERVKDALRPLEIEIEEIGAGGGDEFVAIAPTFRPDLEREIDIVEEVARRIGFNEIPRTLPAHDRRSAGGLTVRQRERRLIEDVLVGTGASEAMTVPLVAACRPRAVRAERRGHGRGDERAASRGADPAPGDPARPAEGGRRATSARDSPTSRCSSSATSSPPRRPGDLLPDERDHLARAAHRGPSRRSPIEAGPPGRRVRRRRRARAAGGGARAGRPPPRRGPRARLRPGPQRRR